MCGIAGFYLPQRAADEARVRTMCDQIRHRGPDDEGYHIQDGCGIGMRRLSIIDLSTGHQPMANEDGTVWVVFNGEIYNFQALRQDLLSRGHRFRTNSDTETLVHLYEEYGTSGFEKLRGMFAYALWDSRQRSLYLVRDRFGKKPLYYAVLPEGLYFASELKCLRVAGVPLDLDPEALRLFFQFSYIPDPLSPFQAVRKLMPGCWMLYDAGRAVQTGRYWKAPPPLEDEAGFNAPEMCGRLRETFDEAVRLRMISDVPLGAFLSGGIDSSCVVASMSRQSSEPVKTFSIGFAESAFNELPYAARVARQYRTDHHEIVVKPDSVELTSKLVRHFDEPFGDSSAIPTYIVSEFAARHVKVALSGDGGDEVFGGYTRFADIARYRKLDYVPRPVLSLMDWVAERLPYGAYGKNYLHMISRSNGLERYFEANYAPYFLRQRLLHADYMLPADGQYLFRAFQDCLLPAGASTLSQALYWETTVNLPGDMLVKVDRTSMANSLEVRCPLLDAELADLAARIPNAWKIRNGRGKFLMIQALGELLPAELLNRPKMGFGVPLAAWFRTELREMLVDHLTSSAFLARGIASGAFVRALIEEHQSQRRDNSQWLWSLLMLELWFLEYESSIGRQAIAS